MNSTVQKIYNSKNDLWGEPQIYKGVSFYPLRISDSRGTELFYRIFQFPKNYIPDKQIIKMSYLKYLLFVIQQGINPDGTEMKDQLIEFFGFITRGKKVDFYYNEDVKTIGDLTVIMKIGEVNFSEQDFDDIREIVLTQNCLSVEYIEAYNPELEKFVGATGRFKNITFGDNVFIYCAMTSKTIFDIKDLTLYQFKKSFERVSLLYNHGLYSPLEISGQIKSKTGGEIVKHFMDYIPEEKRYSDILIPTEQFVQNNPDLAKDFEAIHGKGRVVIENQPPDVPLYQPPTPPKTRRGKNRNL